MRICPFPVIDCPPAWLPQGLRSRIISERLICRGLLYCMEYLEESLSDWLGEELQVMEAPL